MNATHAEEHGGHSHDAIEDRLQARVDELVSSFPPLTEVQRTRISALLQGPPT
jgi:hypothetical protein